MNNYRDILDAMQIYGDKLDTVNVGWIDKDGIQIKDFVRLIFHNDLYVIFGRQMEEREETYKVDYSDIRSIHGMLIPSVEYEHETREDDSFLKCITHPKDTFENEEEMLRAASNLLKELICKYGHWLPRGGKATSYGNLDERDWYIRLEEFVIAARKHRLCYNLNKAMGFKDCDSGGLASEWRCRIYNTVTNLIKIKGIGDDEKHLIAKILPHVKKYKKAKTSNTKIEKVRNITLDSIKNKSEIDILRELMFNFEKDGNIFKPQRRFEDLYFNFVDKTLEDKTCAEIAKVTGASVDTLYGWGRKTRENINYLKNNSNVSNDKKQVLEMIEVFFV